MSRSIPTYLLNNLSKHSDDNQNVFIVNEKVKDTELPVDVPFRSNYYGVGICIKGKAELKANLESYVVESGCLVAMSPQIIKQWPYMSGDFETLTVFFTKDFITNGNNVNLDQFHFFENIAQHSFKIKDTEAIHIGNILNWLKNRYESADIHKEEILKNLINVLLYEITSMYDVQRIAVNAVRSRGQLLTSEFKLLLGLNCTKERSLNFYAEKLSVTSKHLTETVKEVTGKTAGKWIYEAVALEAKVLLQNPELTIAKIADALNFPEQSTFGKFFKHLTGLSPTAYRQRI